MKLDPSIRIHLLSIMACAFLVTAVRGDEGMWLLDDLPKELLDERYGFVPSDEWAKHIMLSSVRFSSGGSASFVSSNGLVLTNHHVAADTLHKLSTPENNIYENGFLAHAQREELKAPDLELNQLVSIEDVTEEVDAAVTDGMDANEAYKARQATMAEIEKQSLAETGLRSDVITLYGGAKYHLYRFKKYTDVRLVWAPEATAAFFGGDADNFEYPRYCLDVTLVRVYEDGKPAQIEHFLEWSDAGADDGELVFVSGNPGNTQRITTLAGVKHLRDDFMPYLLNSLARMEIALQQYANEGPEHYRQGSDDLFGVQNSRKAVMGMLQGLQTPEFIERKAAEEESLRSEVQANSKLRHFDDAWERVAELEKKKVALIGLLPDFRNRYFTIAKHLVLMAGEDQKPSGDRLREYRESNRESLELDVFSPAPIYDDLETAKFATELALYVERRGGDDPLVQKMLDGKSPRERAADLVSRSELNKVDVRRQLSEGGLEAIAASDDALIRFFREIEPEFRSLRETHDELDELKRQAYAEIDEAKVAVRGTSGYPDATFSLRLAFGVVKGYEEGATMVPPWTTMGGAFDHETAHEGKEPWQLPDSWHKAKEEIEASTPFNFVCTADIIGGNSGSPLINRAGEFVGIIFDSNLQGLTASYFYDDKVARAVSVHSSAIPEALRKIYGAHDLAEQLGR
ncbi:MAG TPA: S46 family peptidase [Lacipirellulaceae bacterium]|nr:S46 family peptidase [Lacipirellulaceae bacterium]